MTGLNVKSCGYKGWAELTITMCQNNKCCSIVVPPQYRKWKCVTNNYPFTCNDFDMQEKMVGNVTTDTIGTAAWWGKSIALMLDDGNVVDCDITGKVQLTESKNYQAELDCVPKGKYSNARTVP